MSSSGGVPLVFQILPGGTITTIPTISGQPTTWTNYGGTVGMTFASSSLRVGDTLAPTHTLDVAGTAAIQGATSIASALTVTGNITASAIASANQLLIGTSTDNASNRAMSALQSGMVTGSGLYMTLGQAATANNQLELCFNYAGSGASSNSASLGFFASAASNRLWYTAAGNLGIGVQAPQYALDAIVPSTTNGACVARFGGNAAGVSLTQSNPQVCLNSYWNGSASINMASGWSGYMDLNPTTGFLTLRTSASSVNAGASATFNSALTMDPSGKVGVFKIPTCALDVTGACKSTLDCTFNTTLVGALGFGTAAGFMYNGLPATGYALLQTSAGQTAINNVAGAGIYFKDSATTGMTYMNKWLRIGDSALPTTTLDVSGALAVSTTASIAGLTTMGGGASVTGAVTASGTIKGASLASTGALTVATTASVGSLSSSGNITALGGSLGAAGPRLQVFGPGSSGGTSGIDISGYGGLVWSITATDNGSFSANLDISAVPGQNLAATNRMHFNGVNNMIGVGGQTNPQYTLDVNGGVRQTAQVFGHWVMNTSTSCNGGTPTPIPSANFVLSYGTFVGTTAGAVLNSNGSITFPVKGIYTLTYQVQYNTVAANTTNATFFVINTVAAMGITNSSSAGNRFGSNGGGATSFCLSAHTGIFAAGDTVSPSLYSSSSNSAVTFGTTLTVALVAVLN